ncbi:MAG: DNA-binding domain-containing protein [Planctomycetota bacterium]|nr:DNA-binding domain-containing protein [Planctomycetota bacterium]MDA1212795.1 DNA-binding domain-containing protein [Planctomycetota bacterium]
MTSPTPHSDPPTLNDIQRWMQQIILHPAGVVDGLETGIANDVLAMTPENLETVIERSRNLSSVERLQIYNQAYFARLMECLRAEFPSLCHALGDSVFDGFAFEYLKRYPSNSYTLGELGRNFPPFLAETRRETFEGSADAGWTDFIIDLARLERLYADVFDGPGIEGQPPFLWDQFRSIDPDDFPRVYVQLNPAFRTIELKYPVQLYITAARQFDRTPSKTPLRIPDPCVTWLAVTRRDYVVHRGPLLKRQYVLLQALQEGVSLDTAVEHLFETDVELPENISTALHDDFREWTRLGYIYGLKIE